MFEFIVGGILVCLSSAIAISGVFLWAIHYGYIKITPELEEYLNKLPFWNIKNETNQKKKTQNKRTSKSS